MALGPGDAKTVSGRADDARDIDRDLFLADFGEGIIGAGIIAERQRALVGRKIIGPQPILAHNDRVSRDSAHLLDEAGKVEGYLRIGRIIASVGGRYGLGFAKFIHLHHPGHNRAARALPDKACGQPARQRERAKERKPPIPGLHPRRTDPVIPGLGGALIGCFGFGRPSVTNG